MNIAVIGPGPQFKGGIAHFTVSLCQSLKQYSNSKVHLFSWSQQYPAIIPRDFKDKNSKSIPLQNIEVDYCLNFNNPFSWFKTANKIAAIQPDLVIIQWAIALQGLPLAQLVKRLKKLKPSCIIVFDVHNVVQKESSSLDFRLTRAALSLGDKFIVHGKLTEKEFKTVFPKLEIISKADQFDFLTKKKELLQLYHPNYDMFESGEPFDASSFKKHYEIKGFVFLFFGFIRKYKGLHYTLQAFAEFIKKHPDATLVIAGESFWNLPSSLGFKQKLQTRVFKTLKFFFIKSKSDETLYNPLSLIKELGIEKNVVLFHHFIANEEVHQYFKIADAVVNFYEYATPSGIESIAYQFGVQIVATPVGHFNDAIIDGKNGYKAKSFDLSDLAAALERAYLNPVSKEQVKLHGQKFSWKNYVESLLGNMHATQNNH